MPGAWYYCGAGVAIASVLFVLLTSKRYFYYMLLDTRGHPVHQVSVLIPHPTYRDTGSNKLCGH